MANGITMEECIRLIQRDIPYEGEVEGWGYVQTTMEIISVASAAAAIPGGLKYTAPIWGTNIGGFWRGSSKGKNANTYYRSSQALSRSGATRNIAYRTGMNAAKNVQYFRVLRIAGFVGGAATTGVSLGSFIDSPNWRDGIDVALGAAGLFYWPIGVAHTYYTVLVPIMWQSIREHHIERARQVSKGNIGNAMMMSRGMRR